MKKLNRNGEVNYNKHGFKMVIVDYKEADDIWIKFENAKNLIHTKYERFKIGAVRSPYDKRLFNIGFLGEGKYKPYINKKPTKHYKTWKGMFDRCYCKKYLDKNPKYKNCEVAEVWHNFQNFAEWYEQNYYEIEDEIMALDKDILIKGNKIYSPDTCVFVPMSINNLFVKCDSKRGKVPIGVYWNKNNKNYTVMCSILKKGKKQIGTYNTPEEAFFAYKTFKEKLIKSRAEEYKDKIPYKLYEAMINYIVEIND